MLEFIACFLIDAMGHEDYQAREAAYTALVCVNNTFDFQRCVRDKMATHPDPHVRYLLRGVSDEYYEVFPTGFGHLPRIEFIPPPNGLDDQDYRKVWDDFEVLTYSPEGGCYQPFPPDLWGNWLEDDKRRSASRVWVQVLASRGRSRAQLIALLDDGLKRERGFGRIKPARPPGHPPVEFDQ